MLLKKIRLNNFRQFYGEQELVISCDPEKNVTLLHAENGVGKTTLLNAILWCFYKDTTQRFEQPDKIANHEAIKEGNSEVKIEVLFEHEGKDYQVSRKIDEKHGDEVFNAFEVKNGNFSPINNAHGFIDSVVPREMARYFFFDGEYAETFSSQNNKAAVKDALENMLGCRTALNAKSDLNSLKSELEKQVSAIAKNDQSSIYQEKIDSYQKLNDKDTTDLDRLESNLDIAKTARDEIVEKLRGAEAASAIQKKRDSLQDELDKLKARKLKLEGEIAGWIDESGICLISKNLEEKTQTMLEDAKAKGKIPSYVAEKFVQDLLEKGVCICDRHFDPDSTEAGAIKKLLQEAGTAIASDRLMDARAKMGILSNGRKKALTNLENIKTEIEACNKRISDVESKLDDCHTQLKGSNVTEIAERETALQKRNQEIEDLNLDIGRIRNGFEQRKKEIKEYQAKRDKSLQSNDRARELNKRKSLLDATIVKIEEELDKYKEESRKAIALDVNNILDKAARRAYIAKIDEKFNLEMYYKESETSVARSGGENQLLSLAFMASLIKFSSDRMESKSEVLKPGTSAPMVLDSPFGQLDPAYRVSTADFLPRMAKQVILLVSKSQGDQEVLNTLKGKIGAEYVLISENVESRGDKPEDIIKLYGKEIKASKYNCEKNLTKMLKVA